MPDILSEVSAEADRKCEDIKESENCNAKGDCYWAKVSSTNSKCFSINDPNFASIIENDLYFTAPIPIDDSQYDVLNLLPTDKDNFIRLAQKYESFKQLIGNEEFMELLILIRTDGEAYNTVVEFFKSRFSKENLKNLIPNLLKKKLDEFEQKKLRSGREKKPIFTLGLNNVPKENPEFNVAGGRIPGNFGETQSDGGAEASPPDEGAEASPPDEGAEASPPSGPTPLGSPPPDGGASTVPTSGAEAPQKAEGQIVYDSTKTDGGGDESVVPVYANAGRKRPPALPPRKQPFNIEEEMINSSLEIHKFPGYWGIAETPK